MHTKLILTLVLSACMSLAGCVSSSKSRVTVIGTTTVSKGQEMIDLQRALDEGAISQSDYEKVQAKLLKRK